MKIREDKKLPAPVDPVSRRFALARDLIQRNRREPALTVLDGEVGTVPTGVEKGRRTAKVAALVGDYEMKRGRFSEAAGYYATAVKKLGADDVREWFRAALGRIRALLALPSVDEAFAFAQQAWLRAKAGDKEFEASATALTIGRLTAQGRVEIGPRPLRPSVVASRMGEAFLQAGEWEMAEFFFNEALLVNPNGACRARQALSRIALAGGRNEEAEARAKEALLLGKYRAKTLSAWPLLVAARVRQKKPLLTAEDMAGLASISGSGVRARAVLILSKAIRPHADTWMDMAMRWVEREGEVHSSIRLELEKLIRAEARLAGVVSREQAAVSLRQARSKDAAPSEAIAAGKAYVRTALLAGADTVQWQLVESHLKRRYNEGVAAKATHAMALAAAEVGRRDLARLMLTRIRASLPPRRAQWMRSTWALARMEAAAGDLGAAYHLYSKLADNRAAPSRFRSQALLLALRCAKDGSIDGASPDLRWLDEVIREETDHRVVLDLARQLKIAGAEFDGLKNRASLRARELAEARLAATGHPASALALLLELNRRQLYDLGQAAAVADMFDAYAKPRLAWLWSENLNFWEWYSNVVLATARVRGRAAALALADPYINDPGTPAPGRAYLAAETGLMMVRQGRLVQSMPYFTVAVENMPSAEYVATAYYWFAVKSLARGEAPAASGHAEAVLRCVQGQGRLAKSVSLAEAARNIIQATAGKVAGDGGETLDGEVLRDVERYRADVLLRG